MTPAEMMNLIDERKRRRDATEETSTPAAAAEDYAKAPAGETPPPHIEEAPASTCPDCQSDLSPNGRCDPCRLLRFVTGAPLGKTFELPEHWNAHQMIAEQAQHRANQEGRRVLITLEAGVLHIHPLETTQQEPRV